MGFFDFIQELGDRHEEYVENLRYEKAEAGREAGKKFARSRSLLYMREMALDYDWERIAKEKRYDNVYRENDRWFREGYEEGFNSERAVMLKEQDDELLESYKNEAITCFNCRELAYPVIGTKRKYKCSGCDCRFVGTYHGF